MSRPFKIRCSKCGADVTMSGSQICTTCTPINLDDPDFDFSESDKQPILCARCFEIEHGAHMRVGP